jgi:hypothetical protein
VKKKFPGSCLFWVNGRGFSAAMKWLLRGILLTRIERVEQEKFHPLNVLLIRRRVALR